MFKITLKYYLFFPFFYLLFACSSGTKITSVETSVIQFNASDTPDEDSAAIKKIAPYKIKVESEMRGVLIYSEQAMTKGEPEGLLGNCIADITLRKARDYYMLTDSNPGPGSQVDFCLLNNGGLRASLPEGEITRGNVYELMPFGNAMVIVTLSGKGTKTLFERIAKWGGEPISGVKMGIKDSAPVNIMINGEPFDINKNYRIATSDYLATRGGEWDFFSDPIHVDILKLKLRDVIIEFMIEENRQDKMLKSQLDGRIYNGE